MRSPHGSRCPLRAPRWAAAGAALFLLACGSPRESERVAFRFVDPQLRVGAAHAPRALAISQASHLRPTPIHTETIPTETLADDTRPVLGHAPRHRLASWDAFRADESGVLQARLPLPPELPRDRPLLLSARASTGGAYTDLPPVLAIPRPRDGGAEVALVVDGIDLPPGAPVALRIDAQATFGSETLYRTPPVDLPSGAWLHLGLGVAPERIGSGAVAFRVSACEEDRCAELLSERLAFDAETPRGWADRVVPLDDLGGERRSFRFETKVSAEEGAVALPLWADPQVRANARQDAPARHLLLVSLDTLRADHLGIYGYERDTSPFMDRAFGEEGSVFTRFTAAATTTGPSHMSIMTSLPPSEHGARRRMQALSAPVPTLAELLRAEGFATAAFTENATLDRRRGFGLGFDRYVENKTAGHTNPRGDVEETFARARTWLAANRDARSFVFLHTYQVHAPYAPPPAYRELFADVSREEQPVDDYDREIRYTDDQVAKLLGWMADEGLLEHSLVVITSDHGEEFREHGGVGHQSLPHQELVHVPLLMRGPGVPRGGRFPGLGSHVDLVPTLLDLLGVEAPPHARGRSLVPLFSGGSGDAPPVQPDTRPVFSESWSVMPPYQAPGVAVRQGDHKLIRYRTSRGFAYRLFDLEQDPGERSDIGPRARARAGALLELLRNEQARAREGGGAVEVDPELEERLRALGYVD